VPSNDHRRVHLVQTQKNASFVFCSQQTAVTKFIRKIHQLETTLLGKIATISNVVLMKEVHFSFLDLQAEASSGTVVGVGGPPVVGLQNLPAVTAVLTRQLII
jgi:hypothetical protein